MFCFDVSHWRQLRLSFQIISKNNVTIRNSSSVALYVFDCLVTVASTMAICATPLPSISKCPKKHQMETSTIRCTWHEALWFPGLPKLLLVHCSTWVPEGAWAYFLKRCTVSFIGGTHCRTESGGIVFEHVWVVVTRRP